VRSAVAFAVTGLGVVGAAVAIGLDTATGAPWGDVALAPGWTGGLAGLATAASGAFVVRRRGADPVGVALVALGLSNIADGIASATVNVVLARGGSLDRFDIAIFLAQRWALVPVLLVPIALALLPDSRLPRRAGPRTLALTGVTLAVLAMSVLLLAPTRALAPIFGEPDARLAGRGTPPELPLTDAAWAVAVPLAVGIAALGVVLTLVSLLSRRSESGGAFRLQVRWLAWAATVYTAQVLLVLAVVPYLLGELLGIAATTVMAATIAIVVTRTRLSRIDGVITWSIVSTLLVATVLVLDVMLLVALGALIEDSTALVVATVLALLAYTPVRDRLVTAVARAVSGSRGDPFGAADALGERLELAVGSAAQLGELARAVQELLGARGVRIRLESAHGGLEAHAGELDDDRELLSVPLLVAGDPLGELTIDRPRRPLASSRDRRLLTALVRQTATAIRASAATDELRLARERLVAARESERLRLHRDLHDGLGPVLAGVRMRIDAARNLATVDPERAGHQLDLASVEVGEATDAVRRAVIGLRPPALDDVGLEGAIRRICTRLDHSAVGGIAVSCRISELPERQPAVDVACTYLVGEAVANAVRHSGGTRCDVSIAVRDEHLVVRVSDDGGGMRVDSRPGTGLASMRERVDEVGGRIVIESDEQGTRIIAQLPLHERMAP
jgi:signal transduction histidine kinase